MGSEEVLSPITLACRQKQLSETGGSMPPSTHTTHWARSHANPPQLGWKTRTADRHSECAVQTHGAETAPEVYFTRGGGSEKTKRQQFVTWWCLAGGELERQLYVVERRSVESLDTFIVKWKGTSEGTLPWFLHWKGALQGILSIFFFSWKCILMFFSTERARWGEVIMFGLPWGNSKWIQMVTLSRFGLHHRSSQPKEIAFVYVQFILQFIFPRLLLPSVLYCFVWNVNFSLHSRSFNETYPFHPGTSGVTMTTRSDRPCHWPD